MTQNSVRVTPEQEEWPQGEGAGVGRGFRFGDRELGGEGRGGEGRGVLAGTWLEPEGPRRAGRVGWDGSGQGTPRRGGGCPGSRTRGGRRGAAPGALTAAERRLAVPDVQAGGFPAGLPQGQVVLVVGRDPGRTQHGPQVQAQRQEDAHQPDQFTWVPRLPPRLRLACPRRLLAEKRGTRCSLLVPALPHPAGLVPGVKGSDHRPALPMAA
jgi:hypothetical protein